MDEQHAHEWEPIGDIMDGNDWAAVEECACGERRYAEESRLFGQPYPKAVIVFPGPSTSAS